MRTSSSMIVNNLPFAYVSQHFQRGAEDWRLGLRPNRNRDVLHARQMSTGVTDTRFNTLSVLRMHHVPPVRPFSYSWSQGVDFRRGRSGFIISRA